jgi:hypothetical protein
MKLLLVSSRVQRQFPSRTAALNFDGIVRMALCELQTTTKGVHVVGPHNSVLQDATPEERVRDNVVKGLLL